MSVLYTLLCLAVAIGAGAAATWLLIRIDRMGRGYRLGRRALMVVSALAAALEFSVGYPWLGEGARILSMFLMIPLTIAWSIVHYIQKTRLLTYQVELGLMWWTWIVAVGAGRGDVVGAAGIFSVHWLMYAVFGGLALYPARRRHLRWRPPAETPAGEGSTTA